MFTFLHLHNDPYVLHLLHLSYFTIPLHLCPSPLSVSLPCLLPSVCYLSYLAPSSLFIILFFHSPGSSVSCLYASLFCLSEATLSYLVLALCLLCPSSFVLHISLCVCVHVCNCLDCENTLKV